MSTLKVLIVAVLLVINHFCNTDSKQLQDSDLFRGGFEPIRYYFSPSGSYIGKRVPNPADMMIRFGKRSVTFDTPVGDLNDE
ncbi:unnamed protein product [Wuchereria bancrofti]|uniref:Uncharacterized protein n=1 Tax=Wuchereria bancrofti TaxID=6293 RepID=A0A3P7EW41_WUCBA|nr:unnamed protein product [Wuchereria bancrofti]